MIFVLPKVEEIKQGKGLQGIYDAIEYAGKTCTNGTPKGGEVAKKFTQMMIDSEPQHGRPLEFGTVYLKLPWWDVFDKFKYLINPYSKIKKGGYVTTNYRVIVENDWYYDLKYLCDEPTKFHEVRRTLHWTVSRVTADSFRTHCALSSLMQSTRYCNYSKNRFGSELIYVFPQWAYWRYGFTSQEKTAECDENLETIVNRLSKTDKKFEEYIEALKDSEKRYLNMLAEETEEEKNGTPITAQFARGVLPLDIKTEFVQCGFEDAWKNFFYLRVEKSAHPDAQYIAAQAQIELNLFNNESKTKI